MALALAACGRDTAATSVLRFIDSAPQDVLDYRDLTRGELGFDIAFAASADRSSWRLANADGDRNISEDGLQIRPEASVELIADVDFDAADIEAIELLVGDEADVVFWLSWAAVGEVPAADDVIRLPEPSVDALATNVVRFEVAAHPSWRGPIGQLHLRVESRSDRGVLLQNLRGRNVQSAQVLLAEAVGRAWLFDLDHEVRAAIPQIPGEAIERRFTIPANSTLRFAYAIPGMVTGTTRLRVSLARGSTPTTVLFDTTVRATEQGRTRWREIAIDLAWQCPREPRPGKTAAAANALGRVHTGRIDRIAPLMVVDLRPTFGGTTI